MNKAIVLVAGGSGGHILPSIELVKNYNANVLFFTLSKKLDKKLTSGSKFKVFYNTVGKSRLSIFQILWVFLKSLFVLSDHSPDRVITTGGKISIPVCLAAKFLGIPIDLYEFNAIAGRASKFISRLTNNIFVTFKDCKFNKQTKLIDYPVRFSDQDKTYNKEQVASDLGLKKDKKTIFVMGGSQGSLFLNKVFKNWIEKNTEFNVIHQVGSVDKGDWNFFYKNLNVSHIVFDYCEDIKQYYQAADLVISRAGAGALFELKFFEKQSVIIPLQTTSTSHQFDNAMCMYNDSPELFNVVLQDDIQENATLLDQSIKNCLLDLSGLSGLTQKRPLV